MSNIKTKLHHYFFNISTPAEEAKWSELTRRLSASGVHCMSASGDGPCIRGKTEEIEIETKHPFPDQYNTADGRRVFDWRLVTPKPNENQDIRRGHWVEQTPELVRLKTETLVCGYCGKKYGTHHPDHSPIDSAITLPITMPSRKFCAGCLGGEYLKPEDLHLLELRPLAEFMPARAKLTEREMETIMPIYIEAQNREGDARSAGAIVKARRRAVERYNEAVAKSQQMLVDAAIERDAALWLLGRNMKLDPIFYSHTRRFCFGWIQPLAPNETDRLLEVISEFPWPYDIKTTDRGTLSGG